MKDSRRKVLKAGAALAVTAGLPVRVARAQQKVVKIGMSMPQTGSLGAGGQAALLALRIWVDDVNKKGGLLNRQVELFGLEASGPLEERPDAAVETDVHLRATAGAPPPERCRSRSRSSLSVESSSASS